MQKNIISKRVIALLTAISVSAASVLAQNVNLNNKVVLTVVQGESISLDLKAVSGGTPVRIVSGSDTVNRNVGSYWTGSLNYHAGAGTMTIYGDLSGIDCSYNGSNVTAVDGTSAHTNLTYFGCNNNNITSFDLGGLTRLTELYCYNSAITQLDLSGLTALKELYCHNNALTSLNMNGVATIKKISCYGNALDACALDAVFGSLPMRQASENAYIRIKSDAQTNPGALGCQTPIANAKNWKVMDGYSTEITNTDFTCVVTDLNTEQIATAITLYPNPVMEVLLVQAEGDIRSVRIYNIYGVEVAVVSNATHINLAHLPAGAYTVMVETDNGIGRSKVIKK